MIFFFTQNPPTVLLLSYVYRICLSIVVRVTAHHHIDADVTIAIVEEKFWRREEDH